MIGDDKDSCDKDCVADTRIVGLSFSVGRLLHSITQTLQAAAKPFKRGNETRFLDTTSVKKHNRILQFTTSLTAAVSLAYFGFILLVLLVFGFFSTEPKDWLGRTPPKLPILCRLGCKTLLHTPYALLLWNSYRRIHMGSHSIICHPAEVTFPPLLLPVSVIL